MDLAIATIVQVKLIINANYVSANYTQLRKSVQCAKLTNVRLRHA